MGLADDVADGPPEWVSQQRTKIDAWLDAASEQDREAALQVLRDPAWRHVDVGVLFRRNGLNVSDQIIGSYRNRRRYDAR